MKKFLNFKYINKLLNSKFWIILPVVLMHYYRPILTLNSISYFVGYGVFQPLLSYFLDYFNPFVLMGVSSLVSFISLLCLLYFNFLANSSGINILVQFIYGLSCSSITMSCVRLFIYTKGSENYYNLIYGISVFISVCFGLFFDLLMKSVGIFNLRKYLLFGYLLYLGVCIYNYYFYSENKELFEKDVSMSMKDLKDEYYKNSNYINVVILYLSVLAAFLPYGYAWTSYPKDVLINNFSLSPALVRYSMESTYRIALSASCIMCYYLFSNIKNTKIIFLNILMIFTVLLNIGFYLPTQYKYSAFIVTIISIFAIVGSFNVINLMCFNLLSATTTKYKTVLSAIANSITTNMIMFPEVIRILVTLFNRMTTYNLTNIGEITLLVSSLFTYLGTLIYLTYLEGSVIDKYRKLTILNSSEVTIKSEVDYEVKEK